MLDAISLYQSVSIISIFTVNAFIFYALSLNIPLLFTAIPQHIIISLIQGFGYRAFLKTLHNHFW